MAPAQYRLPRSDYRYGPTCPRCTSPKAVQAARCAACYRDDLLAGLAPALSGEAHPQWIDGRSKRSRATGAPRGRSQPQSHPWRKLIARDVAAARRRAA